MTLQKKNNDIITSAVDIDDAAALLGVDRNRVKIWMTSGHLKYFKKKKKYFICKKSVTKLQNRSDEKIWSNMIEGGFAEMIARALTVWNIKPTKLKRLFNSAFRKVSDPAGHNLRSDEFDTKQCYTTFENYFDAYHLRIPLNSGKGYMGDDL